LRVLALEVVLAILALIFTKLPEPQPIKAKPKRAA
jgi:hypothetical protein